MNLHSGSPIWLVKNGLTDTRPSLRTSERCDVAVIGAGITGALLADALSSAGLDVVIVERRESGIGSTSASTALIQYEIDVELIALREKIGTRNADRAYRAAARAVDRIATVAAELSGCEFNTRSSLYLASTRGDAKRLQHETDEREKIGFNVEWWSRRRVAERYGFSCHGAIHSALAGEVDALKLTRRLLERAALRGARWYEQTDITGVEERPDGVRLISAAGIHVDAKRAIVATGYAMPAFLPQDRVALHSTYALATERLTHFGQWDDRCLVWESARPYTYMRTTDDRRIIIGGEDVPFRDAAWRDRLLPTKTKKLEARLRHLLPAIATETAFEWAGTFAETADGLPCIGADARYPGLLFALGYGGNGITFSMIAAELLTNVCLGTVADGADLYRFDR